MITDIFSQTMECPKNPEPDETDEESFDAVIVSVRGFLHPKDERSDFR